MYMHEGYVGYGHFMMMGFGMILLLLILIAALFIAIRYLGKPQDNALSILHLQYAEGKIGEEEFKRKKKLLK